MRSSFHWIPTVAATLLLLSACGAPEAASRTADSTGKPAAGTTAGQGEAANTNTTAMPNTVYDLKLAALDGSQFDLSNLRGKVTLVVNVASACGYTPQYAGMQRLHAELAAKGFTVLGVPSNDFGGQEPGSAQQIQEFCSSKFQVTFPMLAKQQVKAGAGQSELFALLGKQGQLPNWNFCKYLIGKDGSVLGFYPSRVAPDDAGLRKAIEQAL
jgi:glutathione peroxidase